MTKSEAKQIAYAAILDFIEYTRANPSEGDDGNALPRDDAKKVDAAFEQIYNELVRRVDR